MFEIGANLLQTHKQVKLNACERFLKGLMETKDMPGLEGLDYAKGNDPNVRESWYLHLTFCPYIPHRVSEQKVKWNLEDGLGMK